VWLWVLAACIIASPVSAQNGNSSLPSSGILQSALMENLQKASELSREQELLIGNLSSQVSSLLIDLQTQKNESENLAELLRRQERLNELLQSDISESRRMSNRLRSLSQTLSQELLQSQNTLISASESWRLYSIEIDGVIQTAESRIEALERRLFWYRWGVRIGGPVVVVAAIYGGMQL
jgi:predicted RNase H-like nuclease (RuvC/YqgF family)